MAEAALTSSKKSIQIYKCHICEKTFNHKGHFNRHNISVHLEEKNYKCEECDKCFSTNWHLKRHNNDVHKGIKKFGCPECPENFAQIENLERHIKRGKHTFFIKGGCPHCKEDPCFKSNNAKEKHFIYDKWGDAVDCIDARKKRKEEDKKRMEENEKIEEEIRKQTFKCSNCDKTIRGLESRHLRVINEFTDGIGTVWPKSTICDTTMLPKRVRQAALKREGVLEFAHGYLICGCGCGSKSWESNFHY